MESAWQEVATGSEQKPNLPRSGHAAVALPSQHSHDVLIFGGYTESETLHREATNEAWVFAHNEGWTAVKFTGDKIPCARLVAQAAVVDNSMYLIGGWDPGLKKDGGEILGDVWELDLVTFKWTEIKLQENLLPAVSRHQAAVIGPDIYIHTHRNTQDMLVLDTAGALPQLTSVPISGPEGSPTSRGLHSMTAVNGKLYIYGGAPKTGGMLGDLWEVDPGERRWAEVDAEGQMPHVRCSHGAAAVGDTIYFFGGSHYREEGGLQPLDDIFAYDSARNTWLWPETKSPSGPRPRNAHSMTALKDGRLLVFGGWDPFKKSFNDSFLFDPSKLQWTEHAGGSDW